MAEYVERVIVATPSPSAGQRVIASPFQFFLDGNDNIRIEAWNAWSGTVIQVYGRYLNEAGDIEVFQAVMRPTDDRQRTVQDYSVARGYLMNLIAFGVNGPEKYGQTFVRISVIRGLTGATIVFGILLQGYLSEMQTLGWPGSALQATSDFPGFTQSYGVVASLPGSNLIFTVPTNTRQELIACSASLTTDATAIARRPFLRPTIGSGGYYAHHPQSIAGSTFRVFYWAVGLTGNIEQASIPNTCACAMRTLLGAGDTLQIGSANMQAGDQFISGTIVVNERLEVN